MASGKQTPRQKMINMMYLVLTALLALNISKDILDALTKLDNSLAATVNTVNGKNTLVYDQIRLKANDNPEKAKIWQDKANQVKKASDELFAYIEGIKTTLVDQVGREENGEPKALDNREKAASYLLQKEKKATELKGKIEAYRSSMVALASDEPTKSTIKDVFNTDKRKVGDNMASWESANFEHFPLAAILPFLTDYQAKIRNTESDLITSFNNAIGGDDIKVSKVRAIVIPNSTYVTQGDEYVAQISLAAYDETAQPEIYIGNEKLPAEQIKDGVGVYKFKPNKTGEIKWGGKIVLPQLGGDKTYDIPEQVFRVAPPSVVISPTKMNVLYRGVDNPIDIGVPGVDPSKLRVSGPGVSGSNGSYSADVSNVNGTEVTISVSVVEEDGTSRVAGSKPFRIKGLPPGKGMIFKKSEGTLSANALSRGEIEAILQDFPFDMDLNVVSFEVSMPGFPPEQVRGNKMPSGVQQRIQSLRPGSTVTFRDIKATGPKGVRIPSISPVVIDVQ